MHNKPYPFADGYDDFLHRLPGRDHRMENTHMTWEQMNRKERRTFVKDNLKKGIPLKEGISV